MSSSWMLRRVALVRTDVSEEISCEEMLACHTIICHNICHIVFLHSVHLLLHTPNVVPSSPILVTLMMEAIRSSETTVIKRVARRNILEEGILQSSAHHHNLSLQDSR
jgi:hypothetical protein